MVLRDQKRSNANSPIEKDLARLLDVLDEKSRAMLWHLWWYRHAKISELRNIIDTPGDFEVLYRLKEIINGEACLLWGKPAVGFEQSKIDTFSGERVLFSWWFLDNENVYLSGQDKPWIDMFDEKDRITIIVKLQSSIDLTVPPDIQLKNSILRIKLKKT